MGAALVSAEESLRHVQALEFEAEVLRRRAETAERRVREDEKVIHELELRFEKDGRDLRERTKWINDLEAENERLRAGIRNITSGIDHTPTRSFDAGDADRLYSFIQSTLGIVDARARELLSYRTCPGPHPHPQPETAHD